jgi:hypothetical protein
MELGLPLVGHVTLQSSPHSRLARFPSRRSVASSSSPPPIPHPQITVVQHLDTVGAQEAIVTDEVHASLVLASVGGVGALAGLEPASITDPMCRGVQALRDLVSALARQQVRWAMVARIFPHQPPPTPPPSPSPNQTHAQPSHPTLDTWWHPAVLGVGVGVGLCVGGGGGYCRLPGAPRTGKGVHAPS